jgi:peptide/nickel transport system substrate-binding protein
MKRKVWLLLCGWVIASLVLAACGGTPTPPPSPTAAPPATQAPAAPTPAPTPTPAPAAVVYPREETLYTSGTQWGPPSNWNPLQPGTYAMGTIGLCYETLFLYNPLKNEYIPWLAESGNWTSDKVYEVKLRKGITWADGKPMTAQDVAYTFELGKLDGVYYKPLWDYLEKVEAVDDVTARFTFKEVHHQAWSNLLYSVAIVPKHAWEGRSAQEIVNGQNVPPLCSGPYLYEAHSEDRVVWKRNDNWWGIRAFQFFMAVGR